MLFFGANDARLMDISKNELQVEGENDIRFVLNIAKSPAVIEVTEEDTVKKMWQILRCMNLEQKI